MSTGESDEEISEVGWFVQFAEWEKQAVFLWVSSNEVWYRYVDAEKCNVENMIT